MTPSATGTLAATPLAHALIYARNRRLTGRLELTADGERSASIILWHGAITAVEMVPLGLCPGGFFGAIVYELGYIDSAMLDATLLEISKTKRLHGEVLIERSAITVAQRDEALVEQIHRKVHHLFSFPETATYAFYDARAPATEPPVAVDCVGPVWRGIRDFPPAKFLEETVRRVGTNALRVTKGGSARLPPAESTLMQALAAYPMTLEEMKVETELPPARVELLVYLLVIAKCVEAVSGARTHPSTGALPINMPSGPIRSLAGGIPTPSSPFMVAQRSGPPSSGRLPTISGAPPSSGRLPPSSSRLPPSPPSSSRLPPSPPSSSRLPPPSSSRLPPSSPRMPVPGMPGSSPRIPAVRGSAPNVPAVRGSLPNVPTTRGSAPRTAVAGSPVPPTAAPAGSLAPIRTPAEYGLDGIAERARSVEDESYFEVLGVPDDASPEAVRAAFLRLAKAWHPDRLVPDFYPVRADVAKVFAHMTRAHQTLCDKDARTAYLAARSSTNPPRPRRDVVRDILAAFHNRQFDLSLQFTQELTGRSEEDDAEALALATWASVRGGEATEDELRAALPKFDRAVNMDRTDDQAVYYRGLLHKRLNNLQAAFRDFARAVQLNPDNIDAEREVRIFAMRVRKGSGEHKMIAPLLDKLTEKK